MKRISQKISEKFRRFVTVVARLIGLKRIPGGWDTKQIVIGGWLFLAGLPIGLLTFGNYFSLFIWLGIVIAGLTIANLDDALLLVTDEEALEERSNVKEVVKEKGLKGF
jgi:hypothetical protein